MPTIIGEKSPFRLQYQKLERRMLRKFGLKASHGEVHASVQRYLDGRVAIGGAYFTRRAILLAIHDMKEDLEAPLALQKRALAEWISLKVRSAPQLNLYRDIATAILRMEVIIRSTAVQAMKNGETKH